MQKLYVQCNNFMSEKIIHYIAAFDYTAPDFDPVVPPSVFCPLVMAGEFFTMLLPNILQTDHSDQQSWSWSTTNYQPPLFGLGGNRCMCVGGLLAGLFLWFPRIPHQGFLCFVHLWKTEIHTPNSLLSILLPELKYNALQPCFGPWLGNGRISVDCLYHLASLLRGHEKPCTGITGHAVENMFWEDGKVKAEAQQGLVAYCEVTGLCRVE